MAQIPQSLVNDLSSAVEVALNKSRNVSRALKAIEKATGCLISVRVNLDIGMAVLMPVIQAKTVDALAPEPF